MSSTRAGANFHRTSKLWMLLCFGNGVFSSTCKRNFITWSNQLPFIHMLVCSLLVGNQALDPGLDHVELGRRRQ